MAPGSPALVVVPVAALIMVLTVAGCGEQHAEEHAEEHAIGGPQVRQGARQCHKVVLTDAATGVAIRGVEDIVVDRRNGRAYLSADDRHAVETSARDGIGAAPPGALYTLSLDDRLFTSDTIDVTSAMSGFAAKARFHPHGIDLVREDAGAHATLFAVNRRSPGGAAGPAVDGPGGERVNGEEGAGQDVAVPQTTIEVFDVAETGEAGQLRHRRTIEHPALCRANDVLGLAHDRFLVSVDGSACHGLERWLEVALGLARGGVLLVRQDDSVRPTRPILVADGIDYANGLATDGRRVFVAATRARALLVYSLKAMEDLGPAITSRGPSDPAPLPLDPEQVIPVDGAPDNVSWLPGMEDLLVAVHPSLLQLARYRYGWVHPWFRRDRAPAAVIAVHVDADPAGDRVRQLYRDDGGRPLSAATVAVAYGEMLIVGSVIDEGVMVCRLPPDLATATATSFVPATADAASPATADAASPATSDAGSPVMSDAGSPARIPPAPFARPLP